MREKLKKRKLKRRKRKTEEVDKLSIRQNYPSPSEYKKKIRPGTPESFAEYQKDDNWYNTKED